MVPPQIIIKSIENGTAVDAVFTNKPVGKFFPDLSYKTVICPSLIPLTNQLNSVTI